MLCDPQQCVCHGHLTASLVGATLHYSSVFEKLSLLSELHQKVTLPWSKWRFTPLQTWICQQRQYVLWWYHNRLSELQKPSLRQCSRPSAFHVHQRASFLLINYFDYCRKKGGTKIKLKRTDCSLIAAWLADLLCCKACLISVNILWKKKKIKKSILVKWEHLFLWYFGGMSITNIKYRQE